MRIIKVGKHRWSIDVYGHFTDNDVPTYEFAKIAAEMKIWCVTNLTTKVAPYVNVFGEWEFDEREDAMAFKLRWL